MNSALFIPVILSGGSGSRLWPLSRALRPKQFLGVTDEKTLFQLTLDRLSGLISPIAPIVVANDDHRFLVAEQCKELGVTPRALLLEPLARNTAPAIAAAAVAASSDGEDPILLVLPSDHIFSDIPAFEAAVRRGLQAAERGAMVTFGIVPTRPETGFGYVRAVSVAEAANNDEARRVEAFVEKPSAERAKDYVLSGN